MQRFPFPVLPTWFGVGLLSSLVLVELTLACSPAPAPATAMPVPADPFAIVRATSQAAYQSGKAHLDRGELQAALIDLDTAKVNDPENRPEIQQALNETIQRLESLTPTAAPTAASQRTIVVPTLPAATPPPPRPTPTVPPLAAPPTAPTAPPATPRDGAPPQATPQVGGSPNLTAWRDPQGRFSVSAPGDWARIDQPPTLFGSGVVQFRDPSGRAELDVAVDSASRAVSPELYAATMEIAMGKQVPGYAAEQVLPGSTSGNPSVRRTFTFMQRDATGREYAARGFQITVLKGSTPFIISGSAPAEQFSQFSALFDQMVETFRFS